MIAAARHRRIVPATQNFVAIESRDSKPHSVDKLTVAAQIGASDKPDDAASAAAGLATASAAALHAPIRLSQTAAFAIDGMQVDPLTRQVNYADGEHETLEPRVMEVFVALHRAGEAVVSRGDLTLSCWGGTVVGEDAVQRVIQRLRKVAARSAAFRIETITKVGYRLVAVASTADGARGDAPCLAVLPFSNRSSLPEDESFALGMSEDLIDALSEGANLRVIANSATARFRHAPPADFAAEGRRLGARYFLVGNVRRTGLNLRVSAQLIEAASQAIVWSQKFERPVGELAALQGALVSELAAWLGATVYNLEMDRALRKPANLTAWECVARAMAASREYGAEALLRAISESQRAVEIAPDYGLARAMLALQVSGAYLSFSLPDPAKEREMQVHIDRAFALDPENAAVLAAIAASSAYIGRPGEGLPRALKAIRLRRGHGLAHYAAGITALLQGLEQQGIGHMENFLQIEPESHLHYISHVWRGIARARLNQFDAARTNFEESLTLYPGNFIAKLLLTTIDWRDGAGAAAVRDLAEALELEPQADRALLHARLDRFFAGSDERLEARAALDAAWDQLDGRG